MIYMNLSNGKESLDRNLITDLKKKKKKQNLTSLSTALTIFFFSPAYYYTVLVHHVFLSDLEWGKFLIYTSFLII